jgi:hypothetical protein
MAGRQLDVLPAIGRTHRPGATPVAASSPAVLRGRLQGQGDTTRGNSLVVLAFGATSVGGPLHGDSCFDSLRPPTSPDSPKLAHRDVGLSCSASSRSCYQPPILPHVALHAPSSMVLLFVVLILILLERYCSSWCSSFRPCSLLLSIVFIAISPYSFVHKRRVDTPILQNRPSHCNNTSTQRGRQYLHATNFLVFFPPSLLCVFSHLCSPLWYHIVILFFRGCTRWNPRAQTET